MLNAGLSASPAAFFIPTRREPRAFMPEMRYVRPWGPGPRPEERWLPETTLSLAAVAAMLLQQLLACAILIMSGNKST